MPLKPQDSYGLFVSAMRRGAATGFESPTDGSDPLGRRVRQALHDLANKHDDTPTARARIIGDFSLALAELHRTSKEVDSGLVYSPSNRIACLLQSALLQNVAQNPNLEMPFDNEDINHILGEVRTRSQAKYAPLPEPGPIQPIHDEARIVVMGDFGTGLYGAPISADTIAQLPGRVDLLLHLGDIYYSGEVWEVQSRFLPVFPKRHGSLRRTLNGNHEMYSGGFGYFESALPDFNQSSSYFAMQNSHWLMLFLDTAYTDRDLDERQVTWILQTIADAGEKKVILFSHHPLFSNFKDQGVELQARLGTLLESRRISAWVWGHEHYCVRYEPDPAYGLTARCFGNGSMPHKRSKIEEFPLVSTPTAQWRQIDQGLTPRALVLDGPNPYITEKPNKYVPHGFAILDFSEDRINETICYPDGGIAHKGSLI